MLIPWPRLFEKSSCYTSKRNAREEFLLHERFFLSVKDKFLFFLLLGRLKGSEFRFQGLRQHKPGLSDLHTALAEEEFQETDGETEQRIP